MKNLLFYKLFPVPGVMNMTGAGVDITETAVRFARIVSSGNEYELKEFGEYPLPSGAFSLGKIHDPEAIRAVLSLLKKEHNIFFVRASLSETQAYLVAMDVSTTKKSDLRESIEIQIEEHVPLAASEAAFDYTVVDSPKSQEEKMKVLVSVAPKELVAAYSTVFESAELRLLSFETDAQALARAVIPAESKETFMIIHFGPAKIGIYIVENGMVQFASDSEINLKENTPAALSGQEKKEAPEDNASQNIFQKLKEEVEKHFIYWDTHKAKNHASQKTVDKIVLCGEVATPEGLIPYLSANLHTPVEIANVWTNVLSFDREIPKINFQESIKYATAIGLAINSREF